jgi:hypothetical protein
MEEGMQNVNIHTFGYDANWSSSSPDILNVHTFGRSLLEDMRNAPSLWDSDDVSLSKTAFPFREILR